MSASTTLLYIVYCGKRGKLARYGHFDVYMILETSSIAQYDSTKKKGKTHRGVLSLRNQKNRGHEGRLNSAKNEARKQGNQPYFFFRSTQPPVYIFFPHRCQPGGGRRPDQVGCSPAVRLLLACCCTSEDPSTTLYARRAPPTAKKEPGLYRSAHRRRPVV